MFLALAPIACAPVLAEDPDGDPRPLETSMVGIDDAFTTGDRLSEVSLTVVRETRHSHPGDSGDRRGPALLGALSFTHGITDRVDGTVAAVGVSYVEPSPGGDRDVALGDLAVDVKWRFHGDGAGEGLHVAYRPGVWIPVGRDEGEDAPGLGLWLLNQALVMTRAERRFVFGFEAGVSLPLGDGEGVHGFGFASAGASYRARGRVKPELELSYAREVLAGADDLRVLAATAGLIVNATDAVRIDVGLRYGVWTENSARYLTGSVNLAWTFGSAAD